MIAKLLQVGNNSMLLVACLATTQTFYFAILEEYYTGKLILGLFNGVSDGSFILISLFLASGLFGTSHYSSTFTFSFDGRDYTYRYNDIVIVVVFFSQCLTVLYR